MFKESVSVVATPSAALELQRKSPSQWAVVGAIAVSLLLCSCKEKDALQKEQADMQTAFNQAKAELDTYQAKMNSVLPNVPVAVITLEEQLKASEKANKELTQAVSELNSKAKGLQEQVSTLRPKVEAYKAKYLR